MTARTAGSNGAASTTSGSTGRSTKRSTTSRRSKKPVAAKTVVAKPVVAKPVVAKPVVAKPVAKPAVARRRTEAPPPRTSEILRRILEENPQDKITVDQIVKGMGTSSFGTSLMVFSIPEVIPIPIPGMSAIVALPTGIISAQMLLGNGEVRLPKSLLKRSIPRKAFASAIKTIMPFLERAEKKVKPRWKWASTPTAKRFLGAFIFLLAAIIALPIPVTNMPPAIAIFIISLGLVEQDGKLIALGVALGLASIALIGGAFLGLFSLFGL